jgi:hypothetical protein
MKILIPAILLAATATQLHARGGGGGGGEGGGFGGGGFREGGFGGGEGFREEAPRFDDSNREDVNIQREGNNDFRVEDNNGSANVRVRPDGVRDIGKPVALQKFQQLPVDFKRQSGTMIDKRTVNLHQRCARTNARIGIFGRCNAADAN